MLPLDDLHVLDLSRLLPGPLCSMLLADLGADVVKLEDPQGGDYARWWPPLTGAPGAEAGALFVALNRNKRSLALDLKRPGAAALVRRLVRRYDVVLESFRPGVMARLGLGYEALRAENPRVIVCSISGYGQSGPYRERAGHDLNYLALSGVLGAGGAGPDTPPQLPGGQLADVGGGGLYAATAILAAVHARGRTGQGAHLDIAMTEGVMGIGIATLARHLVDGGPVVRGREELTGGRPCYGVYPTADGRWMSLAALEPKFWQTFVAAVDRPDLAGGAFALGEEGATVRAELSALFRTRTRDEWTAFFAGVDCCVEPVLEQHELRAFPHHAAREVFFEAPGPGGGPDVPQLRTPLGGTQRTPAPALGADSRAVLRECGVDDAELARLAADGVLVTS